MPFEKVRPEKLSRGVIRQIEQLILRGILRPGDRLPSERDLAERMGVSRPSLREALGDLQGRGLLESRAGSGVYVADVLGSAFSEALVRLFATHEEALFDAISFRRDMEGLAAERAARLGSETDLAVIAARFEQMERAHRDGEGPEAEARHDAEFHLSIIEAGHNVVLLHMMRSMYDLLREGVFYNRRAMFGRSTTRGELLEQHRAILEALQRRDPAGARGALERHLDYVEGALREERIADRNEALARKRYDHLRG